MPTRPARRGTRSAAKKGARAAKSTRASRTTKRAVKSPARRTSVAAPRRATVENPSRGITRVDQESRRTHGFVVRLDYKKTSGGYRPQVTRFFPDGRHGGRRGAWQAAEAFLVSASRKKR